MNIKNVVANYYIKNVVVCMNAGLNIVSLLNSCKVNYNNSVLFSLERNLRH